MSTGDKYRRTAHDLDTGLPFTVNVYAVLEAFDVRCPARQHAIKKLLCAGIRGKASPMDDLKETVDAVNEAVRLQENREDVELI